MKLQLLDIHGNKTELLTVTGRCLENLNRYDDIIIDGNAYMVEKKVITTKMRHGGLMEDETTIHVQYLGKR